MQRALPPNKVESNPYLIIEMQLITQSHVTVVTDNVYRSIQSWMRRKRALGTDGKSLYCSLSGMKEWVRAGNVGRVLFTLFGTG